MTPTASVLPMGSLSITHDRQIPGAPVADGFNFQTGFGLFPGFEFVGRLATNDLSCNLFLNGACPSGTIRDFSASMKWKLPLPWDERRWPSLAVGATDLGGAATYFRSYYAVASQSWERWKFSLGHAQAQVAGAPLNGTFGSIQYEPRSWLSFTAEQIGQDRWLSAKVKWDSSSSDYSLTPYAYITRSLRDQEITERQWFGIGLNFPLGSGVWGTANNKTDGAFSKSKLKPIAPSDIAQAMKSRGFFKYSLGESGTRLILRVENSAYHWNLLDAFGSALGVLAAAFGESGRSFRLEVTQNSLVVGVLVGDIKCAKELINEGTICSGPEALRFLSPREFDDDQGVKWNEVSGFSLRPELIVSPSIITALGTEFGALDLDTALNINWLVPLWPGAYYDWNRIAPINAFQSGDFDRGKPFYSSRFLASTNRKMFHQIVPIYPLSTVLKGSVGTAYTSWQGWQIESVTYLFGGQHRIGLSNAQFAFHPTSSGVSSRDPRLVSWRYAPKQVDFYNLELQAGKFWTGDRGYNVSQRFWYGDTSVAVFFRRSRMREDEPLVSFAGFQIQIPLTWRHQPGFQHLGLRGTNQWSYAVESKILEKDNRITPGYGIIPRTGDGLSQWLNRDRVGTEYLDRHMSRLREAYWSAKPD